MRAAGYRDLAAFTEGKLEDGRRGWVGLQGDMRKTFLATYAEPPIRDLINIQESVDQQAGVDPPPLEWVERHMVYPQGRCLELVLPRASAPQTTLLIKFHSNLTFSGKLSVSLTDPNREYFRPDIFTSSGDRMEMEFSKGWSNSLLNAITGGKKTMVWLAFGLIQSLCSGKILKKFCCDHFSEKTISIYRVKLHQTEDLSVDPEANCVTYPAGSSYRDCTLATLSRKYMARLGCLPPWFAADFHSACNGTFTEDQMENIEWWIYNDFDLLEMEQCKVLCCSS